MVIYNRQLESIMFRYIPVILYLFLIGCEDNFYLEPVVEANNTDTEEIHQVFYFDPDGRLPMDENGFYHLTIDTTNWQTLHRVSGFITDSATTNSVVNCRVEWESSHSWTLGDTLGYWVRQGLTHDLEWVGYDTSYVVGFEGQEVPTINPASYSNADGEVNTMIAPVQSMIGDTMTIWYSWGGWYTDWKTDSIKIILN